MMQAQMPTIIGAEGMPIDTISKRIEDYAQQRFFYKVSFAKDSKRPDKKTEAQCVLEIGRHGSIFTDFYQIAADSINDAIVRQKGTTMEIMAKIYGLLQKSEWKNPVLKGYPAGKDYHQYDVFMVNVIEYSCPSPTFDWQIGEETKEVMGYMCRKATCHHSGRDYMAWYTEDIPLSDGPYIFRGLPGLIAAISSDDGEYSFVLNGLQEITFPSPIYLQNKQLTRVLPRDEARKVIHYLHENLAEALRNSPYNDTPYPADFSHVPPMPYNPLEKE